MKPIKNNFKYITMNKKTFLFASALAMSLTLASCSQETDVIQEKERKTVQQYESVDELTKRLKEYDSKFALRKTPLLSSKDKKGRLTWVQWLKVGIADVKGGLSGTSTIGGCVGAIVGAAIASIEKYVEILDSNRKEKDKKELVISTTILSNSSVHTFNDSIGYYHNMSEEFLYDVYKNNLKDVKPDRLIFMADRYMCHNSAGYKEQVNATAQQKEELSNKLYNLNAVKISDAEDFFAYLNKVKLLDKSDSEYLDFASEYLYTCVCSNVGDVRDYTLDVLQQIDGSNASDNDKDKLSQCIIIAYSSLVYSAQMEYIDINQ